MVSFRLGLCSFSATFFSKKKTEQSCNETRINDNVQIMSDPVCRSSQTKIFSRNRPPTPRQTPAQPNAQWPPDVPSSGQQDYFVFPLQLHPISMAKYVGIWNSLQSEVPDDLSNSMARPPPETAQGFARALVQT